MAAECGCCVNCGRVVGGVIIGGGHDISGGQGVVGVEKNPRIVFCPEGGGFPVFGE